MEQQGKVRLQHEAAQLSMSLRKSSCSTKQQDPSLSSVAAAKWLHKTEVGAFPVPNTGKKIKNKSFPTSHSASTKAGILPEPGPERAAVWFPTPHTIKANFAAPLPSLFGTGAFLQWMPALLCCLHCKSSHHPKVSDEHFCSSSPLTVPAPLSLGPGAEYDHRGRAGLEQEFLAVLCCYSVALGT